MNEALRKVLAKHNIETFELNAHPTKDCTWTLKTAPAPTPELIEDFEAAWLSIQEIEFQSMVLLDAPYAYCGVATEPIAAGQRVEYCAAKGLIRVER